MGTNTLSTKKRKNIDLPLDTFRNLSILAAAHGKSLKAYIENILISEANMINKKIAENPSPGNDPWFDDPKNIEIVNRGIEDVKAGKVTKIKDPKNIWESIL